MVPAVLAKLEQHCCVSLASSCCQERSLSRFLKHRWNEVSGKLRDFSPAWALSFICALFLSVPATEYLHTRTWLDERIPCKGKTTLLIFKTKSQNLFVQLDTAFLLKQSASQALRVSCWRIFLKPSFLTCKITFCQKAGPQIWLRFFTYWKAAVKINTHLLALETNWALLSGQLITARSGQRSLGNKPLQVVL